LKKDCKEDATIEIGMNRTNQKDWKDFHKVKENYWYLRSQWKQIKALENSSRNFTFNFEREELINQLKRIKLMY
jgi:hypothetical protein